MIKVYVCLIYAYIHTSYIYPPYIYTPIYTQLTLPQNSILTPHVFTLLLLRMAPCWRGGYTNNTGFDNLLYTILWIRCFEEYKT